MGRWIVLIVLALATIAVLVVIGVLLLGPGNAAQQVGELPTLAVLPSFTPSNTPTLTSTPTSTHTPTSTSTATPSDTPTVTPTFTPSVTGTFTITPTFTLTPTATATNTPTLTATPNTPQITTFTASSTTAAPGTSITLRWSAVADIARIDQLNQQGSVVQSFPVTPNGELAVTIPVNSGRLVVYRLTAIRSGLEVTQSVPVQITCQIAWFFGNELAPAGSGCPTAVGAIGPGEFQPFERGLMIYVNANGLNRIYGLQNEGNQYIAYTSGWNGADQPYDPAPGGLFPPERQFRWAFLNTNAPVGVWQNAIGWATAPIDRGDRTIQFEEGGAFYINTPIGVYRFSGGDRGTWTRLG